MSSWSHFLEGVYQSQRFLFKHLVDQNRESRDMSENNLSCYLKVPLLLMTATFNPRLVSLVESMIGVKILRENYLWSSRDKWLDAISK